METKIYRKNIIKAGKVYYIYKDGAVRAFYVHDVYDQFYSRFRTTVLYAEYADGWREQIKIDCECIKYGSGIFMTAKDCIRYQNTIDGDICCAWPDPNVTFDALKQKIVEQYGYEFDEDGFLGYWTWDKTRAVKTFSERKSTVDSETSLWYDETKQRIIFTPLREGYYRTRKECEKAHKIQIVDFTKAA